MLLIPDMSPSKSVHRDHHSSSDKRDGNHIESWNSSSDQRKDTQRISESDRGRQVVKTCSVHTAALPTIVYRSVVEPHYLIPGQAKTLILQMI